MEIVILAIVLVFIGVVVFACIAAFAYAMFWFLLLFWPAVVGTTLMLIFLEAEAGPAAMFCLLGGICANIAWWVFGARFQTPTLPAQPSRSECPDRP
jgi:hypothetical protein